MKAKKKRASAYKKYNLDSQDYISAGISRDRELTHAGSDSNPNGWGFVIFAGKVMLARGKCFLVRNTSSAKLHAIVLSIYKRSGHKTSSHGWTPTASAITSVSYIPVQLYEHFNGRTFHAVPSTLYSLQVKQFALLPSAYFVIITDVEPSRAAHTENVQVSIADASRYYTLSNIEQRINLVIKNINSRASNTNGNEDGTDSSDEE